MCKELLRLSVIQALGNPLLAAQLRMLSSPRRPSSTILILSSAEKWRRVTRRMSLTTYSAGFLALVELPLFAVPSSLRRVQILLKSQPQIWVIGADEGQWCIQARFAQPALRLIQRITPAIKRTDTEKAIGGRPPRVALMASIFDLTGYPTSVRAAATESRVRSASSS